MSQILFRRGNVVLVPFPYVSDYTQSKVRPAVVIQNDIANQFSPNLILALISSTAAGKEYPMHYRVIANSPIGKASGLDRDSIVKNGGDHHYSQEDGDPENRSIPSGGNGGNRPVS
ncbi:MAG: hypothetical protein DRQ02_05505 [Candidatus Latescibacterota bacterium]|nr:MAG: hypothetical protein DRQ02_05505 [Candidatus Latescibacterota bacterium]